MFWEVKAGLGICSFGLLLKIAHIKEQLWAICSRHSLKKSRRERIALVAIYKRATVSKSLSISLNKGDISEFLMKKNILFVRFWLFLTVFPPFYAQEWMAPVALCSVALFERAAWAICSFYSLKNSNHEQIASVALYKRATMSVSLLSPMTKERLECMSESLVCPFAHKKLVIRSKNWLANSHPE